MSKKPREFDVEIKEVNDQVIDIVINEKVVGTIKTQDKDFIAYINNGQNIGTFRTQDLAISNLISNFNLNN